MKVDLLGQLIGAAALSTSLVFAGSAFAAQSCKADVAKFCPQVQVGGGRIAQCLKKNEAQLSDSCKARLKKVAAQLKEAKEACADDLQQYCAGAKPGGGNVGRCLNAHKDKLSTECKTEMADLQEKK